MNGSTPLCGARTRAGGTCKKTAGWGTATPGFGRCRLHGGATPNGRTHAAREAAKAEAARLGAAIETDPHQALELALALVAGEVAYLRERVEELDSGLDGGDPHPTLRALGGAIDRLAKVAQIAAATGVEERRLELDELIVQRLDAAMMAALGEIELTPAQEIRLRDVLPRHLAGLNDLDLSPARRELGP